MKALLTILLLGLAASAFAADGKFVSYKSGDETVNGMLYTPGGKGPFPALIVIHEWWGLNDWVKEQGSKLADQGYVALAIDLYRGKVADTPDIAHELMRGVPTDRALRDLKAAYDYLAAQPNVKKDRLGPRKGAMARMVRAVMGRLANPQAVTAPRHSRLLLHPPKACSHAI